MQKTLQPYYLEFVYWYDSTEEEEEEEEESIYS
jgi:hypothetical protein